MAKPELIFRSGLLPTSGRAQASLLQPAALGAQFSLPLHPAAAAVATAAAAAAQLQGGREVCPKTIEIAGLRFAYYAHKNERSKQKNRDLWRHYLPGTSSRTSARYVYKWRGRSDILSVLCFFSRKNAPCGMVEHTADDA